MGPDGERSRDERQQPGDLRRWGVACDRDGVTIRRYYPWGAKRVAHTSLKGRSELSLTGANKVRKWRLWGSGDFVQGWNLDSRRPHKDMALYVRRLTRPTKKPLRLKPPRRLRSVATRRRALLR
jgi:hypothetical protein